MASSAEHRHKRPHLTFLAVMLAAAWSALFSPASRSAAALMILSAMVSSRRTLDVRLADFSDSAAAAAVRDSDVGGMTLKSAVFSPAQLCYSTCWLACSWRAWGLFGMWAPLETDRAMQADLLGAETCGSFA